MRHLKKIWLLGLTFIAINAMSQREPVPANDCLPNIGFETGTLSLWDCSSGTILRDGSLSLTATGPVTDRHTVIKNSYPQQLDQWGGFPVNCPNGSGYSVRLGNSIAGGQAEGMSYTFTIPVDNNDFSLLYHYAVVFQNPPHQKWEQPRFTSKIYNVTDKKYIDCGSFEYAASSNLPGFQLAPGSGNVFYKPWSPVTVNLIGLAGKTVRLEFYTNDCAFTQHFGYAYVDVNEDCNASPISGSTYCGNPQSVTLTAPFGFATYSWYNSNFSQLLGNQNTLTITPAPPANTTYSLVITPYDGVGCEDTLYSTVNISNEPFNLNVIDEIVGCSSTGVDLTAAAVTTGSTPGLTYTYYNDLTQTNYVPFPSVVKTSGIYYIKGVNRMGCNEIKPIRVTIFQAPNLTINNPAGVCIPQKIDITNPAITLGSEPGIILSYWKNQSAITPLPNANAIDKSGTYYIMATKPGGCSIVKPVEVKIGAIPNILIHNPSACAKVNITDTSVTSGSTPGIAYSYWTDPAATVALTDINNITVSGTYYLMASATSGCSIIRPVLVTVNPFPNFVVTDPAPANYPVQTIDITTAVNQNIGLTYTYWLDSLTRKPVNNPMTIAKRGRYFIRATNEFGCSAIKPVNAVIIPPPAPIVYAPTGFTPNNDGLNDGFKIKIIGETSIIYLRIYNRWGQMVYDDPNLIRQWNGKLKNIDLPGGVYVWTLGGMDTYFKKPFNQKGLITLIR